MFCTNCGKKIPDGSKFCGYCGADLSEAYAKPADVKPAEPKPEKPPVEVKPEVKKEPVKQDTGLRTEVLARPEPKKEEVKQAPKKEAPKQVPPVQPSQPQHTTSQPQYQKPPVQQAQPAKPQYQAPPVNPAPSASQPQYQKPPVNPNPQYQNQQRQYNNQSQYQQAPHYQQQYNQPQYQQNISVSENDFKLLTKCFTSPYADITLSPIVSVIVFAVVFLINWLSFFGIFSNGLAVTIVVLAGMYVLEYIDRGASSTFAQTTGRIAFHLVLPAVIMLVAGLCGRLFMNSVAGFAFAYSYGSGSSFPDLGLLLFMLFFMVLSVNAFVIIQAHGLKKKTTGAIYAYIIVITLIIVICMAIVSVSSIKSGYDSLTSLF